MSKWENEQFCRKFRTLNTKQKAFTIMNDYRTPSGGRAFWFCQLPDSWKEYAKQVAKDSLLKDMSIYPGDIPEILECYDDMTLWDATDDIFFPNKEHWDFIRAEKRAERKTKR